MHSTHSDEKPSVRGLRLAVRLGLVAIVAGLGGIVGASGCLDRPLCSTCSPQTTNVFVSEIDNNTVDKIDLLFMIDNSSSMKDKQNVLIAAVPDLVNRLVAPQCVDMNGAAIANQPGYGADCTNGSVPEFTAIKNIHIGIVSSSLGDHGAGTTCPVPGASALSTEENNDNGLLIGSRPRAANIQNAVGEDPAGFLNWNPVKDASGPAVANEADPTGLVQTFQTMVQDVDQQGCGFEAQLESWYRFLIDPAPPAAIQLVACPGDPGDQCAESTGTNMPLLAQRKAFLRADSLLAIVMLSDENDCSIRDEQQAYLSAKLGNFSVPNGTDVCATNPNDPCCYNCQLGPPMGSNCMPPSGYPACAANAPQQDTVARFNLRCFDQKQRFGVDFLYPTQRYVNALMNPQVCVAHDDLDPAGCPQGALALNPIYTDLSGMGVIPRSKDLVFLAGIHGVPWQDIQALTDPTTMMAYPAAELHFKTAATMMTDGTWPLILGDVNMGTPATDPLMVESVAPRGGSDPTPSVGALVGPTNAPRFGTAGANPANGHEWNNVAGSDLEYACLGTLQMQVDETGQTQADCGPSRSPTDNNPLCQNADGSYGTTQYFYKGYPCLRELQVIKDFGNNGIVASICARQLDNMGAQDYGYRPAVDAIIERLKEQLAAKCLPRVLQVDKQGNVPCNIVEAGTSADLSNCTAAATCTPGTPGCVGSEVIATARATLQNEGTCQTSGGQTTVPNCNSFFFCGVKQATPDCHNAQPDAGTAGWCYIDPVNNPLDNSAAGQALVKNCAPGQKRLLRFVGTNVPEHGAITLIACQGEAITNATLGGGDGG